MRWWIWKLLFTLTIFPTSMDEERYFPSQIECISDSITIHSLKIALWKLHYSSRNNVANIMQTCHFCSWICALTTVILNCTTIKVKSSLQCSLKTFMVKTFHFYLVYPLSPQRIGMNMLHLPLGFTWLEFDIVFVCILLCCYWLAGRHHISEQTYLWSLV